MAGHDAAASLGRHASSPRRLVFLSSFSLSQYAQLGSACQNVPTPPAPRFSPTPPPRFLPCPPLIGATAAATPEGTQLPHLHALLALPPTIDEVNSLCPAFLRSPLPVARTPTPLPPTYDLCTACPRPSTLADFMTHASMLWGHCSPHPCKLFQGGGAHPQAAARQCVGSWWHIPPHGAPKAVPRSDCE